MGRTQPYEWGLSAPAIYCMELYDYTEQDGSSDSSLAVIRIIRYPYYKEVRNMLAKKTAKNQLTLPKEIADKFPGVNLFDATVDKNRIVLVPVKLTPIASSLESIRDKMSKLGITGEDITEAVTRARKKKPR